MNNNSSKTSKKKYTGIVTSMTSTLPSRKIDINNIGNKSIRAVKNYLTMKNVKDIVDFTIALGQEETGLRMPKAEKAKQKKVLKYWSNVINNKIDYERELEKSRKRRNKNIEKTLKILKIAQPIDSAFRGKFEDYRLPLNLQIPDKKSQDKEYIAKILKSKVRKQLKIFETRFRGRSLKVFFGVEYLGMSTNKETGLAYIQKENTKVKNIATKPTIMLNSKDMWNIYLKHLTNLIAVMFKEEYGESTKIKKIKHIDMFVTNYTPKIGSSYVELPAFIKNKKAVVNIKNNDKLCFLYSILAHKLQVKKNTERVKQYKDKLDLLEFNHEQYENGVEVNSNKILHFEKANDMCINIYGLTKGLDKNIPEVQNIIHKYKRSCGGVMMWREGATKAEYDSEIKPYLGVIAPLRLSKSESKDIVSLFYYEGHYCYIKSFPRFAGSDGKNKHTCPRCLKCFSKRDTYESHTKDCKHLGCNQRTLLPKKTETSFTGYQKQNKKPVVIYGDFEAINHKKNSQSESGSMIKDTEHKSASYRLHIKSEIPLNIPLDYEYVGENANIHFVKTILGIEKELVKNIYDTKFDNKYNMIISDEQRVYHENTDICRFCNNKVVDKVKDHDHYTGLYRGVACKSCNLQASCPKKETIPIYFHNLNYDLRQIINAFQSVKGADNITCIASNSENFKCLSLGRFKFVDTLAFLSTSLEKLIKNVPDEKKVAMRNITTDEEKFAMICKKGEFPYEWFDSFDKLNENIPSREHFYNSLGQSELGVGQYDIMMKTCEAFNIKNFKDFHDLYLKRDVYGLCDVFEYFREISMEAHGLDPSHYIGGRSTK